MVPLLGFDVSTETYSIRRDERTHTMLGAVMAAHLLDAPHDTCLELLRHARRMAYLAEKRIADKAGDALDV